MPKIVLPERKEIKAGMAVDVDLSYISEVPNGLECNICLCPYVQPVQLNPCEHVICYECCKQSFKSTSECSQCRTEVESATNAPRLLVGLLDALQVRCCKCNLVAPRDHYASHECTPKSAYEVCLDWGTKMNKAGKYDAAVTEFSKRISGFEGTKKLSDMKKKGSDVVPLYEGRAFANLKLENFKAAVSDVTACIKWCSVCGLDLPGFVYYIRASAHYGGLGSPKKELLSAKDLNSIVVDLREAIRRSPDDSLDAKGLLAHLHIELAASPTSSTPPVSTQKVAQVEAIQGCADFVLHNSITMLRTYFKQFGKEALAAYAALSPKDREFSLRRTEPFIVPRAGATMDVSGEDCHVVAYLCPEININGLCNANEGLAVLMSYYGDTSVSSRTMSALIYESVQKIHESMEAPGTARYDFVKSHERECPLVDAKSGKVCDTVINASVDYDKKMMDLMRNKKELLWVPSYHRELAVDRLTTLVDFLLRALVNSAPYINQTVSKPVSHVFGCLECGAKHHDSAKKLVAPPVVCQCSVAYYCSKACMAKCAKSHTPICHMGAESGLEDVMRKARSDMNDKMPPINDATTRSLYMKYCNAKKNASDIFGDGDQTLLPQIRSVTCDSQKLRAAWAGGLDFNPRVIKGNTELFKKAFFGDDKGVKQILDAITDLAEKRNMANFRAISNLQVGDRVIIQNIQSKPHLNNTTATVTGRDVGKYQIKLDNSDDEIIVRMENLRRATTDSLCNACKKFCEAPKRCGRCKAVVYCGEDCQKRDWPVHKTACAPPGDTSDIVVPKPTGATITVMDLAKAGIRKSSKKAAEGTFVVKIQVQLDLSTMTPIKGTGVRIYNRDQSLDWCLRPGESVPVEINTRLFDFVCSKGISGIKAYATAKYSKQTGSLTITPVALPLPDW